MKMVNSVVFMSNQIEFFLQGAHEEKRKYKEVKKAQEKNGHLKAS